MFGSTTLARAAAITAATCVAIAALAIVFQRTLIYPTWAVPNFEPILPKNAERVAILTRDAQSLKAWWIPPDQGSSNVIISFSGNASPAGSAASRFTQEPWRSKGWGVLAIAYRGYPGSTGTPNEEGLLKDGQAAVAFVQSRLPEARILFHGHSLGSAVAVAMASKHPAIGLYLEAPFNSMTAVITNMYPFVPTPLIFDPYRSDRRLIAVNAPLYFVHGGLDATVPPALGRALFETRAPAPNQVFRLMATATHNSVYGEADEEAEPFFHAKPVLAPSPFGEKSDKYSE